MSLKKSLLLLCCAFSTSAFAERWFEVEVLVFKQRSAPYLQEDFSLKHDKLTANNRLDLLSALYSGKAQQDCIDGDSRFNTSSFTDSLVNSARSNLCDDSIDYVKSYDQLPLTPDAPIKNDMIEPYLLAPSQLKFKAQQQALVRKGLTPILHTGWRFKGQSKSRAPSVHLFGGEQLQPPRILNQSSEQESAFVSLVDSNTSQFRSQPQATSVWELDGLFKIHLNHYLYITADFDLAEKLPTGDIETARFAQFKRVISHEIHYFDHPKMGMIVQIRKFKH